MLKRRAPLVFFAALGILSLAVSAQERDPEEEISRDAAAVTSPIPSAPVTLDGTVLFNLRGTTSFPAADRADAVSVRIREAAGDASFDPAKVALREEGHLTIVMAGTRQLVGLVDADARMEGISRQELALAVQSRIRSAITRYRTDREPPQLLTDILEAAGAMVALGVVLWLLVWLSRYIERWLPVRLERQLRRLGADSMREGISAQVAELLQRVLRPVRTVAVVALVYACLHVVLGLFPWTRSLQAQLSSWIVAPFRVMGQAVLDQTPNLCFLIILTIILRWLLGLIRAYFEALERVAVTLQGFEPEWAMPTFKIVRMIVIAFGVVMAYPYIPGSESLAFKGMSIFAGIVFSVGGSALTGNLIAGYFLIYRRAFKVGDLVALGDVFGFVTDIRLQATHIRTPKNEEVVVPNSTILGREVINYNTLAKSQGLVLHTTVGIGYETPWRQVEAMLLEAARRTPALKETPPPFVNHKLLGDFCVTYEINVWTDRPQDMIRTYTDLHRNILDVFNEYGVQIMTPAYEGDPEQPKVVPREQWFASPATSPVDGGSRG